MIPVVGGDRAVARAWLDLRELFERANTATDGSCRIEAEYVAISISRSDRP